jgi:glutaredoxin 3
MQAVKMYTTAVCPYCTRAKSILKAKGVEAIEEIRIDQDPAAMKHMMEITGRRTVPQIFIGSTHGAGQRGWFDQDAPASLIYPPNLLLGQL